jgi:hypothetical protein
MSVLLDLGTTGAGICIDFAAVGYRFVSINKRFGTKKNFLPIGSGQVNLIRISLGIFHFLSESVLTL